jgi:hypothetical protein
MRCLQMESFSNKFQRVKDLFGTALLQVLQLCSSFVQPNISNS